MARTAKARIFRSTQTAPNATTVRDLTTAFGTAANTATVAAFPAAGASGFRWNPNTSATAANPPNVGVAPTGNAWRDTVAEHATEPVTYAVGTWTVRVRVNKTVMTVNASVTVRVTIVVYRVTSAGAVPAGAVNNGEIGRVVLADTALPTVNAAVTISGSFSTSSATALDAGDKIQVECYVQNIVANNPAAAVAAYTVAFVVDETSANSGASFTAQPTYDIRYGRSLSESIPTTDSLARAVAYRRTNTESIPTTDTVTRVKGANRSLTESIPTTETLSRRTSYGRTFTESIPTTETLSRRMAYSRSLAESVPTTDTLARRAGYGRGFTESIPLTDSLVRQVAANRTFTESIPTTDSLARRASYARSLSESIPTTDSLARSMGYSRGLTEQLATGGGGEPVTPADIAAIANAVWDELTSEQRAAGSYGAIVAARLDATVSSRATEASVTALGSPAQASEVALLLARLTAIRATALDLIDATVSSRASAASVIALGSPAQATDLSTLLGRLTTARADALDLIDVASSTRASAASLTAVSLLVDDLESRLSAARALLLDNLDVAVSTRATPGDVSGGGGVPVGAVS